jgi:hypothetical protein
VCNVSGVHTNIQRSGPCSDVPGNVGEALCLKKQKTRRDTHIKQSTSRQQGRGLKGGREDENKATNKDRQGKALLQQVSFLCVQC